jgi:hypothetical protein
MPRVSTTGGSHAAALELNAREHKRRTRATVLATLGGGIAAIYSGQHLDKRPMNVSKLSGQDWIDELLGGHPTHFRDQMGMAPHVFRKLLQVLRDKVGIADTKYVSAEEQLAIFLYMVVTGLSNRKIQARFQRSADTISV